MNDSQAQSATLGMGAMNVAMTVISLILIEKAGRKTLMLSGLSVMIICTTVLLICLKLAVSIFKKNHHFQSPQNVEPREAPIGADRGETFRGLLKNVKPF